MGQPALYAISRSVLTVPGDRNHTTGYWFADTDPTWRPSPALEEFLARGPAVSIGFGSMASKDPELLTETVLAAVRAAGLRAVLLSGWGGLSHTVSDDVLVQESVPHEWLFPRMSAVVHHGGAGTTAAGLRAGVPNVVIPFTVDQPFWADRVHQLGAGPRPIPRRQLTASRLAESLTQALTDTSIQGRSRDLGGRISAEDGLSEAVALYEQFAS